MRTLILSICFVCSSFVMHGQSVNGIRVDAGNNLVIVYLDGKPISLPTSSCFIANLTNGRYAIEVYDANVYRDGAYSYRGKLVYRESVVYPGRGVKDLIIDDYMDGQQVHPSHPDDSYYPGGYFPRDIMDPQNFNIFLKTLKDETFESRQLKMLETAVVNTRFTSDQCVRILQLCNFDSERIKFMKLLYPAVTDKQNFFKVINKFDFESNKEEMNRFIKDYHKMHSTY